MVARRVLSTRCGPGGSGSATAEMLMEKYVLIAIITALAAFSTAAQATLIDPASGAGIDEVSSAFISGNLVDVNAEHSQGTFTGKFEEKTYDDTEDSGIDFYYRTQNELAALDPGVVFRGFIANGRPDDDVNSGRLGWQPGLRPAALSYLFVLRTNRTASGAGLAPLDHRSASDATASDPSSIGPHPAGFVVPEPGSMVLFGTMLTVLAIFVRRKLHP